MDILALELAGISYVAGGIPSGYLIARQLKGIDIRQHGSGNPGAANVYRVVGRGAGFATLGLDALKGFLPVCMARHWYTDNYAVLVLCGVAAILGHVWTIFLKFRGGKAVATSGGVFAALLPKPLGVALAIFAVGVALTGHISVGSMAGALAFPFVVLAFHSPTPLTLMAFGVSALILIRHIPNLKRIVSGQELLFKHGSHLESARKKQ